MFTGLVEEIGRIVAVTGSGSYRRIVIGAQLVTGDLKRGDSISVDGACQTATEIQGSRFAVDTLAETLKKTTLGSLEPGRRVNLERAVTPTTRLGGHFVQGHVDARGTVRSLSRDGMNGYLRVEVPSELERYLVREGSIALAGVSLTIAELHGTVVTVNVIPTTWDATTLADLHNGDPINVEVDIIGRYVERMLGGDTNRETMSRERLEAWGY